MVRQLDSQSRNAGSIPARDAPGRSRRKSMTMTISIINALLLAYICFIWSTKTLLNIGFKMIFFAATVANIFVLFGKLG
jgi:hypothetical protein